MGKIVFGAFAPHPPIIIREVGGQEREKAAKTIRGMEEMAKELVASKPETVIFISPHGPVFEDAIIILGGTTLRGDLGKFGASQLKFNYDNDLELATLIAEKAREKGIYTSVFEQTQARRYQVRLELDHGVTVPLDFLRQAGYTGRIIEMGMALFSPDGLYEFGSVLRDAIEEGTTNVAIVASGDLSHRLTPDAQAGYSVRGKEFDASIVDNLSKGDFAALLAMEHELIEEAGECGFRPLAMLLGAFDAYSVETNVYSYEGPYGVGYMPAAIKPLSKDGVPGQLIEDFRTARQKKINESTLNRHPIVALAVESLEYYLQTGHILQDEPELPRSLPESAGVFVSIKKHGRLRGCIGTISPTQPLLSREVIENAISAGTRDPRFSPIDPSELSELTYSVDVLGQEEKIAGPEQLDPSTYGVIVRSGGKSGLLLPMLEGIDTVEEQVRIASEKAGIRQNEKVQLSRFMVERFT